MSVQVDNELLRELQTQAAKWKIRTLPERMSGVGVDEVEVRNQLNTEADQWVQYNYDQRRSGKEGTPSPDFHLNEERPGLVPTVRGPVDRSDWHDEEC